MSRWCDRRRITKIHHLVVALLVGCVHSAPTVPPPRGVTELAVESPVNRTGSALLIDDPGLLGRMLEAKRATVPELLRSDLRAGLEQRGFEVTADGGPAVPTLRTEIRRWEPYSADYSMVMVDLVAALVELPGGRELWRVERTAWRVPTRDARSSYEASVMASAAIADALLAEWHPHE